MNFSVGELFLMKYNFILGFTNKIIENSSESNETMSRNFNELNFD